MDLKVCILPYRAGASGIASYCIELSKALASVNIRTYTIAFGLNSLLKSDLERSGVNVIEASSKDPVKLGLLGPLIEYSVISKKLQMIIEHHVRDAEVLHFVIPAATIKIKQRNIFVTAWSDLRLTAALKKNVRYFQFPLKLLSIPATIEYSLCDGLAFTKAKKIFCGTKSVLKFISLKYPDKAVYLPPPIEFSPKRIFKKDSDKPALLFIARDLDIPRKNVVAFVNAIMLLAKRNVKGFQVKLVGHYSSKTRRLIETIRSKTNIKIDLLGHVPRSELPKIFSSSEVFVYPSFYEEVGYVVLEAMSYGLPVVISDIPTFRDITEGGKNGFLIHPTDYMRLADALELLIEDKSFREKLGEQSLRIIAENHSYKVVAKRALNSYREALS